MPSVAQVELILALLAAVAVAATVARALRVPYPILLVLGGLVLALTPGIPDVELAPELLFLVFLPPLVFTAGFDTSALDIKAQIQPILSLAVGLVLASTAAIGVTAHFLLPELGWPVAFALGALLSPTDAVAATALLRTISAPRRLITLLESESVFNDATALVVYQAALAAAVTASFSAVDATARVIVVGIGAVAIGLVVARALVLVRQRLNDPPVEITISLLTPFAAYLPADGLGLSGVLATATAGIVTGWFSPSISASETRIRARAIWEFLVFVLNGLVFILIGLQLSTVLERQEGRPIVELAWITLLIAISVIVARFAWVFGAAWLVATTRRWKSKAGPLASWRETFVVGWSGLRGVVSLAAALALPRGTPGRDALLFISFGVILVTLVGQGLTVGFANSTLGPTRNRHCARSQCTRLPTAMASLPMDWATSS